MLVPVLGPLWRARATHELHWRPDHKATLLRKRPHPPLPRQRAPGVRVTFQDPLPCLRYSTAAARSRVVNNADEPASMTSSLWVTAGPALVTGAAVLSQGRASWAYRAMISALEHTPNFGRLLLFLETAAGVLPQHCAPHDTAAPTSQSTLQAAMPACHC
jgi:hypothetical protein